MQKLRRAVHYLYSFTIFFIVTAPTFMFVALHLTYQKTEREATAYLKYRTMVETLNPISFWMLSSLTLLLSIVQILLITIICKSFWK